MSFTSMKEYRDFKKMGKLHEKVIKEFKHNICNECNKISPKIVKEELWCCPRCYGDVCNDCIVYRECIYCTTVCIGCNYTSCRRHEKPS